MPSEESKRLRAVYAAALQRDPEERDEYLDNACVGQPELRARVAALLQAHSKDFVEAENAPSQTRTIGVRPSEIQGKVIGPYIVRRELGRGGMGVVYLVDDTRLSRPVALKALSPEVGRDHSRRERLRLEARAAAALSHPGIATVYALEEIGDDIYLAYEYVPGETLRALLASGPVPIARVVTIGAQLARALAAAHTAGVTHRDIKPENVMKTPSGGVKILDFGLARIEGALSPKLTQSGIIVGTPAYMAPEQVLGQQVDFRTDIFAFGLLIYELATGVNPFAAKSVSATFAQIVEHEPPLLSRVHPHTLPDLDRVVATCLGKDPANRYQSTDDLVADFEQLELEVARLRLRASDHSGSQAAPILPQWRNVWWRTHQLVVVGLYMIAVTLGWYVKEWHKVPITESIFIGLGAGTVIGGVLRAHLLFTEYFNRANLAVERRRTMRTLLIADLLVAVALGVDAIMMRTWPLTVVLTMALGIGIALATLVLEPATTKAALEDPGRSA
jgi:serine/threonine protein kinase